jgi:Alginate export
MLSVISRKFAGLIAVALFLSSIDAVRAASPDMPDPTYRSPRYNDDFSYLADKSKRADAWDMFKYMPIADSQYGPSFINFGGEVRERSESYINPNFGIRAPASNAYMLQRLLLNADLHVTDYFRAFIQLGEWDRLGNRGTPTTTDIDHLDLMQGFIDFRPPLPLPSANLPIFRIGREELLFGYQRLVAVREGTNVRRAFDGFRFIEQWGGATFNLIGVRPMIDSIGVFDDHTNRNQLLWGAYFTVPLGQTMKADLYELNYQNAAARYRGLPGEEKRQTYGVRLFGAAEGFDWNAEIALQQGRFRSHDIRAGMLAGIAGYTFTGLPWAPRIGMEGNYASGDNAHGSTIGTFNAMYPRLPYFAETSLLVPANIYDIRPVLELRPTPNVLAVFGWDTLWRASTTDALYGSGMTPYPGTARVSGRRVGTELSADIRWRINKNLVLGAIFAEFFAGPAVQEALGKSVTYTAWFATYRF